MVHCITRPCRLAARLALLLSVLSLVLILAGCATVVDVFVPHHNQSVDLNDIPAGHYRLDEVHSSLHFRVDHMGYSRYMARFNRLEAEFMLEKNAPERAALKVIIDSASVDTADPEMDTIISGPQVLDSARYPEIRFEAAGLQVVDERRGHLEGLLHMKGRHRPVSLEVIFHGGAKNSLTGRYVLGFSATGRFSRSAFGAGAFRPLVGDEVEILVEAEFYLVDGGATQGAEK
ncbi:YceI family protein [Luteithermobacter gelatinilyticus]|uniref:YceI family protein n=1 Tax=Luteithermobacter gelatinilyticus TaxID=2582913 RepID=UPI001106E1FB|nr:YceI family protein [Luteithermobacter gelatinilyticus]|tara:strand:- start:10871 stop:11566 length:696 start_codon:yes stop_codon:yes gene_type:complete